MRKLIHHSLDDWDYRVGARLELATDKYISFPSALRTQSIEEGYQDECIYLGDALGHNIPEGRIITWHRSEAQYLYNLWFFFRCQDTPYTEPPQNGYFVYIEKDNVHLFCYEDGIEKLHELQPVTPDLVRGEWYRFRITWFQYIEANLHKYLRTIVEIREDSEWKQLFLWNDEANKWAESDINRLGFSLRAEEHPHYRWIDDTEVWRKIL